MDLMNVKDDIKEILLERLKSPIINFYLFFLMIYNWDLILMLFFLNGDVNSKILELKSIYENKKIIWILNWRFITPMIYAFLSIILFPFISNFIDNLLNPITKKRMENFYDLEGVKADKDLIIINKRTGNKTLEILEVEKSELNTLLDLERESLINLNKEFTKLNELYTNLQKKNLDLVKEKSELQIKLSNKDVQIRNKNLELKNIKGESDLLLNQDSDLKSLTETEIIILNILYTNLNAEILNNNGSFNFVNYIMSELKKMRFFSEDNLVNIVLEGFKNLYFESNNRDKKILFYEDFTIVNNVHDNLVNNTNTLIKYLLKSNLIEYNEDLTSIKKIKMYQLT